MLPILLTITKQTLRSSQSDVQLEERWGTGSFAQRQGGEADVSEALPIPTPELRLIGRFKDALALNARHRQEMNCVHDQTVVCCMNFPFWRRTGAGPSLKDSPHFVVRS